MTDRNISARREKARRRWSDVFNGLSLLLSHVQRWIM